MNVKRLFENFMISSLGQQNSAYVVSPLQDLIFQNLKPKLEYSENRIGTLYVAGKRRFWNTHAQ